MFSAVFVVLLVSVQGRGPVGHDHQGDKPLISSNLPAGLGGALGIPTLDHGPYVILTSDQYDRLRGHHASSRGHVSKHVKADRVPAAKPKKPAVPTGAVPGVAQKPHSGIPHAPAGIHGIKTGVHQAGQGIPTAGVPSRPGVFQTPAGVGQHGMMQIRSGRSQAGHGIPKASSGKGKVAAGIPEKRPGIPQAVPESGPGHAAGPGAGPAHGHRRPATPQHGPPGAPTKRALGRKPAHMPEKPSREYSHHTYTKQVYPAQTPDQIPMYIMAGLPVPAYQREGHQHRRYYDVGPHHGPDHFRQPF